MHHHRPIVQTAPGQAGPRLACVLFVLLEGYEASLAGLFQTVGGDERGDSRPELDNGLGTQVTDERHQTVREVRGDGRRAHRGQGMIDRYRGEEGEQSLDLAVIGRRLSVVLTER